MENQVEGLVELTREETVEQIAKFRDAIAKCAIDNQFNFDVVFNALTQVAASFMFDFLLLTEGELTDENVARALKRFTDQTEAVTHQGLENMREYFKSQEVTPKIITNSQG